MEWIINFSKKLNAFASVSRKSPAGRGIFLKDSWVEFYF